MARVEIDAMNSIDLVEHSRRPCFPYAYEYCSPSSKLVAASLYLSGSSRTSVKCHFRIWEAHLADKEEGQLASNMDDPMLELLTCDAQGIVSVI